MRRRGFYRGHRGGGGIGMLLLGMQMFNFFNFLSRSDRFFPATLGIMALNIVTHLKPRGMRIPWPSIQQACISVQGVWFRGEWKRLLYSPFVHAHDYHLFYNMASFMWKAVTLERYFGTFYFTYMVAVFSILTGLLYLGIHYLIAEFLDQWSSIQSCAVGFSGVIFSLKVVTTHLQPNGVTMVMGIMPVPTRLACWAELVVISVIFPNVSFVGHLSGILVGVAFVSGPLKTIMDIPLSIVDTRGWAAPGGDHQHPAPHPGGGGGSYTYRAAATGFRQGPRNHSADQPNRTGRTDRTEEEELQEAIQRSLRDEQVPSSQSLPSRTFPCKEDRELQLAIDQSLQQPYHDQDDSPPPDTTPPPYNPNYQPPPQGSILPYPEDTTPLYPDMSTSGEGGGVRRRHVPERAGAGSEVKLDAVRAARLKRFGRTS